MKWNNDTVRDLERTSIRAFVESCSDLFEGRVLDYGCGRQPYRDIVEAAGGEYVGFDRVRFPANVSGCDVGHETPLADPFPAWDVILCNQVIQYMRSPVDFLKSLRWGLMPDAPLVLTGPTCWAEVEKEDLQRFTLAGICDALNHANFRVERAETRAVLDLNGFRLPIGYGVVARA